MSETAKRGDCHCCGYRADLTSHRSRQSDGVAWLCALCAGSMAGNSYEYIHSDLRLQQTICYVGNAILEAIRGVSK